MEEYARQFQDLGDLQPKVRLPDGVGASGVEPLYPDDDKSHVGGLEQIREIVDEHYGDSIERLAGEDEEVVIDRLVLPADDVPYIEYQLIDERESDE